MKILFVSIGMPDMSSDQGGLYADLLRELIKHEHSIAIMAPALEDGFLGMRKEGCFKVLRVGLKPFVGDIPFVKKGIRILQMSRKYKDAYRSYINNERFDVVMMATPPASLVDVIKMVKKRSRAKFYLLLRDMHPECLDRKIIPSKFLKRTDVYDECKKPYSVNWFVEKLLYRQSQALYKNADWIGCMSPGNQVFLKKIAPYVNDECNVLLPNWYNGRDISKVSNDDLREKYHLKGKYIAIFGGTIGEAQAVWNIATLAKHNLDKRDVVFLIVGRGVKKKVLEQMAEKDHLINMRFLEYMPREDYERILELADVGLISIDEKYKVPTCPSKIIGYMALAKPVIAMFNEGNDFGEYYIDKPNCGLYSTDLNHQKMFDNFDKLYHDPLLRQQMGMNGYNYYKMNLTAEAISNILNRQILSDTLNNE